MKTVSSALALLAVAIVLPVGCITTKPKEEDLPPPPYMTEAVMKSFGQVFNGSWAGVKIFVEKNRFISQELERVGLNTAEAVNKKELIERYRYEKKAPAMAMVNAYEDIKGLVHVEIEYSPLRIEGLASDSSKGWFEYIYKRIGNKLILLSSSESID